MAVAPRWINQPVRLYHGTIDRNVASILRDIDLTKSRDYLDFGRGFYTTTRQDRAEFWAAVNAGRENDRPAVIEFELSRMELSRLESLWFIRGDRKAEDYWSFVNFCRFDSSGHQREDGNRYDVIAGPVAKDWIQKIAYSRMDQLSFHTEKAIALLNGSRKVRVR